MKQTVKLFSLMLCIALLCGCAEQEIQGVKKPKFSGTLEPVTGVITLDETPLSGVTVIFVPDEQEESDRAGSIAKTNEEGKYELRHQSGGIGVEAGEYKVIFSKAVLADGSDIPDEPSEEIVGQPIPTKESIPAKYTKAETTTESASVAKGGGEFNFDLTSAEPAEE